MALRRGGLRGRIAAGEFLGSREVFQKRLSEGNLSAVLQEWKMFRVCLLTLSVLSIFNALLFSAFM